MTITRKCKVHGVLQSKDFALVKANPTRKLQQTYYCKICRNIREIKYREKRKQERGLTKREKTKLILARITTRDPARRKALANVVRVIVDTYDSHYKQPLGDIQNVSNKHTRTERKPSQNIRKSIKR